MRGDNVLIPSPPDLDPKETAILVPRVRRNRVVMAHIVNPETNEIQFYFVSTWWAKAIMIGFTTLIICGVIVLLLAILNRNDLDKNTRDLKELKQEVEQNELPKN